MNLTQRQIDILDQAIQSAALQIGAHDKAYWRAMGKEIEEMKKALVIVKAQRRIVMHLTRKGYTHLFPKVH